MEWKIPPQDAIEWKLHLKLEIHNKVENFTPKWKIPPQSGIFSL